MLNDFFHQLEFISFDSIETASIVLAIFLDCKAKLRQNDSRLTCISNLLSFYIICFWTAFISILFAFANLREKIWAHDLHCGENSFSMAARYPDWVDEMMGEALWWEIWFIVNKPKRNVELKSDIGDVHCKREKCCASEPFTWEAYFSKKNFFVFVENSVLILKKCQTTIPNWKNR